MRDKLEVLDSCNVCRSKNVSTLDATSNICRCEGCGFVFDNPRPSAEDLAAFYSKPSKYDSWLAEVEARDRLWKERLQRLLRTRKPGSLLDVGTGIGQFLVHARPYYTEVCGTEISNSAIELASQMYGLSLYRGTIERINFHGRLFDNLTLFHVLEHVSDPAAVVRKCHSVLSDDGVLVIAVPNDFNSLRARAKRALSRITSKRIHQVGRAGLPRLTLDGSLHEIHLSHFTPRVLKRLLHECGFVVLESGLDRYYVATGSARVRQNMWYAICSIVHSLFRVNLYDTILVIARKQPI
jgi:2-polyprenyl-3-methyl-5-hydroxy-6-metoxy-1,4-benzoquinol methylase